MRAEFDLKLARQILPFKFFVLTHIGGDHFLHLLGAQQLADAFIVDTGIVGHKGQASDPAVTDGVKQPFGQAAQAKAAAGNQYVVFEQAVERGCCVREKFFRHEVLQ